MNKDEVIACRYLLYETAERKRAWRLDVENDGINIRIWVNGQPVEPTLDAKVSMIDALVDLDLAFKDVILNSKPMEVPDEP